MSEVSRLTTTPAFCRSCQPSESRWRWSKARTAEVAEEPLADAADEPHLARGGRRTRARRRRA